MAVAFTRTATLTSSTNASNVISASLDVGTATGDRAIVVAVGSETAGVPSSATIAGRVTGATTLTTFGALGCQIFYCGLPTSVSTSTAVTIAVTFTGVSASGGNHIAVYKATGASTTTATSGGNSSTDMDATAPLTTGNQSVVSGNLLFAAGYGATDTVAKTVANGTGDLDVDAGTLRATIATRVTTATAALTITGGTNGEDGVMSYATFAAGSPRSDIVFSAAGTSPSTAVGASAATGVGASAGTVTSTGVSAATKAGIFSSAGTVTSTAIGAAAATGVGAASGTVTSTGIGAATATAVGAAAGTVTSTGIGASAIYADVIAAGTSNVIAIGAADSAADGLAAGTGTGSAVGEDAASPPVVGASPDTGGGGPAYGISRKDILRLLDELEAEAAEAERKARALKGKQKKPAQQALQRTAEAARIIAVRADVDSAKARSQIVAITLALEAANAAKKTADVILNAQSAYNHILLLQQQLDLAIDEDEDEEEIITMLMVA